MKLQSMKIYVYTYIKKSGFQYKRSDSKSVHVTHPGDSNHHGSNLIFNTRDIT